MAQYDSGRATIGITTFVPFTDKHGKLKFMVRNDNDCGKHMIEHGIFEYPLILWAIDNFIKQQPNKMFLDIGAHVGTWSMYASRYCRDVHAFEPQKMTFHALNGGIALNGFQNIFAHKVALSNENGDGSLNIVSADGGGSSLMFDVVKHSQFNYGSEKVLTRTLDSYNFENIGFIKIDVEGFELEVLEGSVETLKRSKWPKIIFEASIEKWFEPKKQKLFDFIKSLGYKVVPIGGYNNMFLAEPDSKYKAHNSSTDTNSSSKVSDNYKYSSSSNSNISGLD